MEKVVLKDVDTGEVFEVSGITCRNPEIEASVYAAAWLDIERFGCAREFYTTSGTDGCSIAPPAYEIISNVGEVTGHVNGDFNVVIDPNRNEVRQACGRWPRPGEVAIRAL